MQCRIQEIEQQEAERVAAFDAEGHFGAAADDDGTCSSTLRQEVDGLESVNGDWAKALCQTS